VIPLPLDEFSLRAREILNELVPLSYHSDIFVYPRYFDHETDTLYMEILPCSGPRWAQTCYQFATQEGMKYDRSGAVYGIDGQPRVSYDGLVWVRYIGDYEDGSKVAFHIWSQQPSHRAAEKQLEHLYALFLELDGLKPLEVFRRFL
jgi:hypothetical protein